MDSEKKKLALLDFDGVLWGNGYITNSFMDYLALNDFVKKSDVAELESLVVNYKSWGLSFDLMCYNYGELISGMFFWKKAADAEILAKRFVEQEYNNHVFGYSQMLVSHLKSRGYEPVIISLAFKNLVQNVSSRLGIQEVFAGELDENDRVYNGFMKSGIHKPGGKVKCLAEIMHSQKYELQNSIAFGDSENDTGMLELVKHPVPLNPTLGLNKIAEQKGWPVVYGESVIEHVNKILK